MQKSDVLLLELWNKIREKLSLELGNGNYAELFENVNEINEFSNNNAYFITKSSFQATRFSHYLNRINELSKSFSPDEIIRFNFMTQEQFNREKSLFKKENKEASISSNINPLYTYSRLIIGAFNVTTYSSSTKIADRPTGEINPLYIFGDTGLGKTHFMHAIGNYILSQNPKYKILYIKANDFRENYVHHSLNKNLEDFKNVYKDIDILLVDDIQMIAGSTKTQEEFFVIFEKLSNLNKQIVITSDRSPLKLKDMADRLVSRFSKGVQVEITHPEYPDRIKIITEKVKDYENLNLSEEAIAYIAQHCYSNIRELEGALNTISFTSSIFSNGEVITLEKTKDYLKHLINEKKETESLDQNNYERVLSVVADYYKLNKADLLGDKRNKEIVVPRHIAMYILKSKYDITLTKIGALFGGKNHSSVVHAVESIENQIKTNTQLKSAIKDISSKI